MTMTRASINHSPPHLYDIHPIGIRKGEPAFGDLGYKSYVSL